MSVDELNAKLAIQSYVSGYTPTAADTAAWKALKGEPNSSTHPHAFRWYTHIASFTPAQRAAFPGASSSTPAPVVAAPAPSTASAPASEAAAPKLKGKEARARTEKKDKEAKAAAKQEKKKAGEGAQKQQQQLAKGNRDGIEYKRADDFGKWYEDIVKKSGLIEYYDISGCYILRPWAYSIWETIQQFLDAKIKSLDIENTYWPLFVSQKNLCAEEDHIEDFAPEVAWVTKSGNSELENPIAVRATSETIMYPVFSNWIQSHRDLPLKINQWCSVVRWEFKKPTPFLRSREFLWQEGHTCHATQASADQEVLDILGFYASVYEELLAVPVVKGRKSEKEKFAGADYTTTVEGFIPGVGRGIQGATSHCLGTNFSKIFDITFTDTDKTQQRVIQNSWGLTTRVIGVAVMVHSDDQGLVLPPRIAPIQTVIIPIIKKDIEPTSVTDPAHKLAEALKAAGVKVKVDDRAEYNPGWKYNHWEVKGVPIRVELGPKDIENNECVICRRDTKEKQTIKLSDAPALIKAELEKMQREMLERATAQRDASITKCYKWEDFTPALNKKHLCLTPWCATKESEELVKKRSAEESKEMSESDPGALTGAAKTLCIPFEQPDLPKGTKCFVTGEEAKCWALWGRSY